ncbi:GGDEF domain-containing protein [Ligilactobacillus salivarius]|nr:GGDEF domain-containing protein [Ligilactobacillus salivarius]MDN4848038.1 GGDEF domain-containing protein [Ligilactobacillus salivarius]
MYKAIILSLVMPLVIVSLLYSQWTFYKSYIEEHLNKLQSYIATLLIFCLYQFFIIEFCRSTIDGLYYQFSMAILSFYLSSYMREKYLGYIMLVLAPLFDNFFLYTIHDIPATAMLNFIWEGAVLVILCETFIRIKSLPLIYRCALEFLIINPIPPLLYFVLPDKYHVVSGTYFTLSSVIDVALGTLLMLAVAKVYVNFLVKQYEELRSAKYDISHDGLTNLLNYDSFHSHMDELSQKSSKHQIICILDIDDFKKLNDTYGHLEGNDVLVYFTKRLFAEVKAHFGELASVYRFGGEEFCISVHGVTVEDCLEMTDKLAEELRTKDYVTATGDKITVTFSGGIALGCDKKDIRTVLREADKALYYSKRHKKGSVTCAKDLEKKSTDTDMPLSY